MNKKNGWLLIFSLLIADDCNLPISTRIAQFKERYAEENRIKLFKNEVKEHCERIEKVSDMNATIEFCRDTGEPCDMHCMI